MDVLNGGCDEKENSLGPRTGPERWASLLIGIWIVWSAPAENYVDDMNELQPFVEQLIARESWNHCTWKCALTSRRINGALLKPTSTHSVAVSAC